MTWRQKRYLAAGCFLLLGVLSLALDFALLPAIGGLWVGGSLVFAVAVWTEDPESW